MEVSFGGGLSSSSFSSSSSEKTTARDLDFEEEGLEVGLGLDFDEEGGEAVVERLERMICSI